MDDVRSISISANGEAYAFSYDPAAGTARLGGENIESAAFTGVFYKYISLIASGRDESGRDGAGRAGAAVAEFESVLADGSALRLELFDRDESTCFMRINGEDTAYYMSRERLSGLLERLGSLGERLIK
jgi:hypothetical protein